MEPTIGKATQSDMDAIEVWLKDEHERSIEDCFFCNLPEIRHAYSQGRLLVLHDPESGEPIAFDANGILEVRHDKRGKGYGKQLVEYCIEKAREGDRCVLRIQCAPSSSKGFWKKMGFTLYSEARPECPPEKMDCAFMLLEKQHPLSGPKVPVIIYVCDECDNPLGEYPLSLWGCWTDSRTILLERRIIIFNPVMSRGGDPCVRIVVDEKEIYKEKAKREGAKEIGVNCVARDEFFIDMLRVDQ